MKKVLLGICSGLLALQMSSCSEDFDVAAPYKDVTIVYGMLNYGDKAQYIRIQKAYMDQNKSAFEMAKIADSNFYPEKDLEVHLKALNSNSTVASDVILKRVDLNNEDFPKEPGSFFTTPNWGYKLETPLNKDRQYRLVIINKQTGNIDSAETSVIDTSRATGAFSVREFALNGYVIDYSQNRPDRNFTITIPGTVPNAKYYEGYIRFNYVTKDNVNNTQKDSFFIWRFASVAASDASSQIKLEVATSQFLPIFKAFIPPAGNVESRLLDSADIYIWAADKNYYNYMVANQVQGGITADQVKPIFTTIQGKDAYGLFGSRAMRIRKNVPVNDLSLDSLMKSNYTRDLGFEGRSDH